MKKIKLPVYVTTEEVKRVCRELGIRDWTKLKKACVLRGEARKLLALVNTGRMPIEPEQFRMGLEVELEHGTRFGDANVSNNHPVITAKIVLAHLKENLDYYRLLEVAELEGDLMNAIASGQTVKIRGYYKKLNQAKIELGRAASARVK